MRKKSKILMHALRGLDPEIRSGSREEAPRSVLDEILSGQAAPAPTRRDGRGRRWRILLAPAAGAIALILALALGTFSRDRSPNRVAVALNPVAEAAANSPGAATAGPFRYLKLKLLNVNTAIARGESWSVRNAELREEWAAPDGSGRLRVVKEPAQFVGPGDRASWERAGEPAFSTAGAQGAVEDRRVPAGGLGRAGLTKLPTEPGALLDHLAAEAAQANSAVPVSARILDRVAGLLRDPTATAELRSALYGLIPDIPGVAYLGAATDPLGRQGAAVGVTSGYSGGKTRYSLVYDPETTEVLATETTLLEAADFVDAAPPVMLSATVFLESSGVGSLRS